MPRSTGSKYRDCDRDAVAAFIRRLYLAGVKDPRRLTFEGLQAMVRG
jgi:hypothetical protein